MQFGMLGFLDKLIVFITRVSHIQMNSKTYLPLTFLPSRTHGALIKCLTKNLKQWKRINLLLLHLVSEFM